MSDLRLFKYQCAGCGAYLDDGRVVDMGHGVWTDDGDHYLCGPAHHTPEYIAALEAEVERLKRLAARYHVLRSQVSYAQHALDLGLQGAPLEVTDE